MIYHGKALATSSTGMPVVRHLSEPEGASDSCLEKNFYR